MSYERELNRLMGFCRHCDETGCLEWLGGMGGKHKTTPVFHFSGTRENRKSMPAYKAHWIFAGKQLRKGERVFRRCGNQKCVAIEHLGAAPAKLMWQILKKDGRFKDQPARRLANAANRAPLALTEEVVREAERLLAADVLQKDVARHLSISKDSVKKIKRGLHTHSANRVRVLPGASIFAMAA